VLTVAADLAGRPAVGAAPAGDAWVGTGRELFAAFRATVGPADQGASIFPVPAAAPSEVTLVRS
jgi:phosphogluconate dehydratase